MNFINLTFLDRRILTQLQKRGMSANEGIRLISYEIYYLNYKDRAIVRKATRLIGDAKKSTIIAAIQMSKRKNYLIELHKNNDDCNNMNCNYLVNV
ncbi:MULTISPECIES: hypothetical protein [Aliivibrio]|uniref:Uncharacterized protein n=1 Tax=Aliivibrio finisterrensis TaxID=511998 RepID=A0A4Q5KY89_9GAMM|nr:MULTISPECIES: hypothetical protein [Aliivibrio]MDD9180268.1 hypothetical protein [Aliivibrio sp. A6]RYU54871.1 hypothetical protein ERW57_01090 [Aliivibrio finisterrensis]RYU56547.1 hypothetical protein ERW56_00770 [Aliivibrio finisterrensis]RYU61668.1 hypothetical protein ERW50_00770 [Aliivibrio finisterrensis]RYU66497.1 hypothetical protein ERW53_02205 [Aliivibrio finisterrensis]